MIVEGKLESVLYQLDECRRTKNQGVNIRKTLKSGRRLGLNENELGSVLKALEMESYVEKDEKGVWQCKQGKP